MSNTRDIIDFAYNDQGLELRNALYAEIHDRVMSHLEAHKIDLAQSFMAQEAKEDSSDDDDDEDEDQNEDHPDEAEDKKMVKKMVKKDCLAKESYDDDEDDDVARADRELARMKAKPIKADPKTNPDKEFSKLAKKTPKEVDESVSIDDILAFMASEEYAQLEESEKLEIINFVKNA